MNRILSILAVLFISLPAIAQQATEAVPIGILDPVAMVAYDQTGNFKYLSIDASGRLIAGGSGLGQTASGPFGFVAPVAPVAIDPTGNWQFLHIDVNGNLMTSGVSGGGSTGGTTGGSSTFTGGTLSNPLYLSGDPTTALQAATKHYVDQAVSGVQIPSNPTFQNVSATQLTLSAAMNAASATLTGALNASSAVLGSASIAGALSANSAGITNGLTVGGAFSAASATIPSITTGTITASGSGAFMLGGAPVSSDPTGLALTQPIIYFGTDQVLRFMDTSHNIRKLGDALTINGSAMPVSASCLGSNSLGQIIAASCSGGTGSMVYPPGSGIPVVVSGTSWGSTLSAPTSAVVGISDTQTLTNKSIAYTEITGKVFPTGTLVGTTDTQTLTNKSIASSEITGLPTFPGSAIVGISDTQTLTNKSINASEINSGTLNVNQMPVGLGTNVMLMWPDAINPPNEIEVVTCSGATALSWTGTNFQCVNTDIELQQGNLWLYDDFLTGQPTTSGNIGQLGWLVTGIGGTGATLSMGSDPYHPGYEKLATAATSGTGSQLYAGSAATLLLGSTAPAPYSAEWITTFSPITQGDFRIGFMSAFQSTAIPTNGIYFRFSKTAGDSNIMACVDNSSTETCTSTGIAPVVGTWYEMYIASGAGGLGSLSFTVIAFPDGSSSSGSGHVTFCSSGCTSSGTVPTVVLVPAANASSTNSTAVQLELDFFNLLMQGILR